MVVKNTAEHWECSIEEYHKSPGSSNSQLGLLKQDPSLYKAQVVDRRVIPGIKPAWQKGKGLHTLMLENILGLVVVVPDEVLSSNGARSTKAYREWSEENKDRTQLTAPEMAEVKMMESAVMANKRARKMIETAVAENTTEFNLRWTDEETGELCRVRLDGTLPRFDFDLKSCQDNSAQAFANSVERYGYSRQRAMYGEGAMRLYGEEGRRFFFIAATKWSCEVYEISDEFAQAGHDEFRKLLTQLAEHKRTGDWSRPGSDEIIELQRPRWAKNQEEWEIGE